MGFVGKTFIDLCEREFAAIDDMNEVCQTCPYHSVSYEPSEAWGQGKIERVEECVCVDAEECPRALKAAEKLWNDMLDEEND